MKIKHTLKRGYRIFNSSCKYDGHRVPVFFAAECISDHYWWAEKDKKWMKIENINNQSFSSCSCHINSVRAFRRRLKEWSTYLPKGTKFRLISNFVGCDVYGII